MNSIQFASTHKWLFAPSPNTGQIKTLTSRVTYINDVLRYAEDGYTILSVVNGVKGRVRYNVGETYNVLNAANKPVGTVDIIGIELADRACDLTLEQALQEGFSSRNEFNRLYSLMHGLDALEKPCYRLTLANAQTYQVIMES